MSPVVSAVDKQESAMKFRFSQVVYTSVVFALLMAIAPSAMAQRLVGNVYNDLGEAMEGVMIVAENPEARPPRFEATTGIPRVIASRAGNPKPSSKDGNTTIRALA